MTYKFSFNCRECKWAWFEIGPRKKGQCPACHSWNAKVQKEEF